MIKKLKLRTRNEIIKKVQEKFAVFEITIATDGETRYGGNETQYDIFKVRVDVSELDEENSWYGGWEIGTKRLILPQSKTAKPKYIGMNGERVTYPRQSYTAEFKRIK